MDTAITPPLPVPLLLLMPTKHMGNLLVSLASVAALAQAAAGRSLVVIDQGYRDIAEAVPDLGPVLYFPRRTLTRAGLGARVRAAWQFYRALRRHGARLAIDFDGQRASAWMARLAGARERAGPASAKLARFYSRRFTDQHRHPHRYHDYAAYCEQYLGAAGPAAYPVLRHRVPGPALLGRLGLAPGVPLVSLHVGATKDYKQWPARHFAALIDWLGERGCEVVLIGAGPRDRARIDAVLDLSHTRPHDLHDRLTLAELLTLLAACRLFIGNDSGPTHLAAAAGIPVLALFGPTDAARWAPLGRNAHVIRSPTPCGATCSRGRCTENYRCMTTLEPAAVIGPAADLLPAQAASTLQ